MSVIAPSILFALCGLLTLALLRTYLPLRTTPHFILVPVFLAILIPCSIVLLVPIDLSSSAASGSLDSRGIVLGERALLVLWRIGYWLCFILTWAILPILQSYSDSGHRSPRKRLTQSLRENARYHLIVISIGILGLIYFIITSGFHLYSLKGLVIALSHCYALTLAIYLMGHGLVAIPRQLFRDASIPGKLRSLHLKAPKAYDALTDSTQVLENVKAEVAVLRTRKHGLVPEFQDWIDELGEIAGLSELPASRARAGDTRRSNSPVPQIISEQYLADVTKRSRLAIHKRARYLSEWVALVQEAANAQAILDSAASRQLVFPKISSKQVCLFNSPVTLLTPYTRHILYLYITPQLRRLFASIFTLASICIVWSEIVHAAAPKLSVVGYSIIHHRGSSRGEIGFAGQVIAASWIAYMCACAFNSMKDVKIWGGYALVKRATSGGSACLYASYACRLTVPLAFNFLGFIPSQAATDSVFNMFLGNSINLTPIGASFDSFFPIFILFPVGATLFNLYGKVKDYLGFGIDVLDDDEDVERGGWAWREGRDLIERELSGFRSGGDMGMGRSRRVGDTATSGLLTPEGGRRSPMPPSAQRNPRTSRLLQAGGDEDGEGGAGGDGDGFWGVGGFFHRVRNTLDGATEGVRRPAWMGSDGSGNGGGGREQRPRWMRDGVSNGRVENSSGGGGGGGGWTRLFGGGG